MTQQAPPLRRWLARTLSVAAVLMSVGGCGSDQTDSGGRQVDSNVQQAKGLEPRESSIRFVDRTAESGIDFSPSTGAEAGHLTILETLGSGTGVADFDADGQLDVFIAGGGTLDKDVQPSGKPPGLFRQVSIWSFDNVTALANVDAAPFYSHGVAVADWNNDGFTDVLLTGYHGLLLYENLGDGTFADVSAASGIASEAWSTSAAWADFNGDSALDLFVVNYVDWTPENHSDCFVLGGRDVCSPTGYTAQQDYLFLANGDGTFVEAATQRGIQPDGKGLAVLAGDIDLDGDVDLYVANDTTPNQLYWNDGDAGFTESGLISGTALGENASADGSMGVDLGDFNGDGLPDLWVANYENQSFALYRNEGHRTFEHVSAVTGITSVGQTFVGFGTAFDDFDRDGDSDLVAVNGHVMTREVNSSFLQRPLLFENLNHQRFREVAESAGSWFRNRHMARGLAIADLDRDFRNDLVVTQSNRQSNVIQNRTPPRGNAIGLRLVSLSGNRDSIGARVTIANEQSTQMSQIKGARSYLSSANASGILNLTIMDSSVEITVEWPSGTKQTITPEIGHLWLVPELCTPIQFCKPKVQSHATEERLSLSGITD